MAKKTRDRLPSYYDGYFDLYKIQEDTTSDFPRKTLVDVNMRVYFNEVAVYDRLRFELGQGGKQITKKIRIPRCTEIDSNSYVKIDGIYHQVYNAAHIVTDGKFQETELTLIAPEKNREVLQ